MKPHSSAVRSSWLDLSSWAAPPAETITEVREPMYFDIYKSSRSGEYWWVAKGANNKTLCSSEQYTTKAAAKNAIRVIKDGARSATVYDETGELSGDTAARRVAV
jgi:uncharacterized protein YegP (UPF0339 family)